MEMTYAFDHAVHFVRRDPEEAVDQLSQYGFHAVSGGAHERWGTRNSLCYFDLQYLEFLAVERPDVARGASENGLVAQLLREETKGEGLIQTALRTTDIERAASELSQKGVRVSGPQPGSRTRPDGSVIQWKMLFLDTDAPGPKLPFLIEWQQGDDERRVDLRRRGVIASHRREGAHLDSIAYAVRNGEAVASEWQRLFGCPEGEPYVDEELNAVCHKLLLPGGTILFCTPRGRGAAQEQLETRGEGPFLVQLAAHGNLHPLLGSLYRF